MMYTYPLTTPPPPLVSSQVKLFLISHLNVTSHLFSLYILLTDNPITSYVPESPHLKTSCCNSFEAWRSLLFSKKSFSELSKTACTPLYCALVLPHLEYAMEANAHTLRADISQHSRGLWTWPPWVICAPAFNHKIGNAAHSGISEVLFFTKSNMWKKRRWEKWTTGRLLLEIMCSWRPPTVRQFHDGWPQMRAQQKLKLLDVAWQCPDYSLLFPCSISFAESFVTCLRNKAYVYLLTYCIT